MICSNSLLKRYRSRQAMRAEAVRQRSLFLNVVYIAALSFFVLSLFCPAFIKANGWGANYLQSGWSALTFSFILPLFISAPGGPSSQWLKLFQLSITLGNLVMLMSPFMFLFTKRVHWLLVSYSAYMGIAVWLFQLGTEGTGIVSFLYGYHLWAASFTIFFVWVILVNMSSKLGACQLRNKIIDNRVTKSAK